MTRKSDVETQLAYRQEMERVARARGLGPKEARDFADRKLLEQTAIDRDIRIEKAKRRAEARRKKNSA